MRRFFRRFGVIVSVAIAVAFTAAGRQQAAGTPSPTRIVMLGTGTPRPDPRHSGPATAILVNDTPYLVDAGPGIVRRAAAAQEKGVKGLAAASLDTVFITHLHSDHTVGYPDLIFTPWVQGRRRPLRAFGPAGLEDMTRHVLLAWQADIEIRTKGLERRDPGGAAVEAHDVKPGLIYEDANVKVFAFPVLHGEWPQAFGYRFEARDRTVVISGDASPSPSLIENCQKCDVLIHEAYALDFKPEMPNWQQYRPKYHTTTTELAEIANKTQPGLLIVYHRGVGPPGHEISDEQYLSEIRRTYRGRVVIAQDLDIY